MKTVWAAFAGKIAEWKKNKKLVLCRALLRKGAALHKAGKNERAIAYFDEVLHSDPENAMAWSFKASALLQLGRMREARDAFRTFTELAGPEHQKHAYEAKRIIRDVTV